MEGSLSSNSSIHSMQLDMHHLVHSVSYFPMLPCRIDFCILDGVTDAIFTCAETFRRPQLPGASQLVDHIIEANQTDRMKTYIEAGSRHRHHDIDNIMKCE